MQTNLQNNTDMKVWNNLCDEISKDKYKDLKENAFQKRISLFFQSALYWSSINDELREQYQIDFAHTKGRADIVLLKENWFHPYLSPRIANKEMSYLICFKTSIFLQKH